MRRDENGEPQPTQEKVPFHMWPEICRLYWLGVDLGLTRSEEEDVAQ
jgi:hypothetical protein